MKTGRSTFAKMHKRGMKMNKLEKNYKEKKGGR